MKLIFVKINFVRKFSKHFLFNFREEAYSISLVKIKFHEVREKEILPVAVIFRMRLNASVCQVNQRKIKKSELNIRSFGSYFFLLSSLPPEIQVNI